MTDMILWLISGLLTVIAVLIGVVWTMVSTKIDNIWQPPKPKPKGNYSWDEGSKNWIKEQV